MVEIFYPDRFLKKIFPKSFYTTELVSRGFSMKKIAKRYLQKAYLVAGNDLNESIDGVLDQYAQKAMDLKADRVRGFFKDAVNNDSLLRNRIENVVIFAEVQNLKQEHDGQYYEWLPSDSENPDPEHQLLYGKIFKVGDGDNEGNMPSERYGCRCGIRWLSAKELDNK